MREGRGDGAAQHAAGHHQRVACVQEGDDVDIHPFKTGGRALKVAMIDGKHHRASRLRIEDPGEAMLHAPVEGVGPFQKERPVPDRDVQMKVLRVLAMICLSHQMWLLSSIHGGARAPARPEDG